MPTTKPHIRRMHKTITRLNSLRVNNESRTHTGLNMNLKYKHPKIHKLKMCNIDHLRNQTRTKGKRCSKTCRDGNCDNTRNFKATIPQEHAWQTTWSNNQTAIRTTKITMALQKISLQHITHNLLSKPRSLAFRRPKLAFNFTFSSPNLALWPNMSPRHCPSISCPNLAFSCPHRTLFCPDRAFFCRVFSGASIAATCAQTVPSCSTQPRFLANPAIL